MNWDDVRFLVVLGRERSFAGGARQLKVDQTTVARRLKVLEQELGVSLFEKVSGNWVPTEAGRAVLAQAERIEQEMNALVRMAETGNVLVSGVVRITAVDTIVGTYLLPALPKLYERHPDLRIEFVTSDHNLSLTRREADLALRLARPQDGNLLIRKLTSCAFSVYLNPLRCLNNHDWVAYDHDLAHLPESRWLASQYPHAHVKLRSNNLQVLMDAVRMGIGQAVLPDFIAEHDVALKKLHHNLPTLSRDLWLLVHPEMRHVPRIDAVYEWITEIFDQPTMQQMTS